MQENSHRAYYKKQTNDSDLALERRRADSDVPGIQYEKNECEAGTWERITVSSIEGERSIGRPCGNYDTLTVGRTDLLSQSEIEDAANEVAKELCRMVDELHVIPERILVVGLGNPELTPDSIGPKTASMVNATMHLKTFDRKTFLNFECSEIAVFVPGVMAKTGIESSEAVISIAERFNPDVVFAIDALASRAAERLGSTIQISNTGIFPGSGIGNRRAPINESSLGIPVIAIGVPTVINAALLHCETGNTDEASSVDGMFVSPREIDDVVSSCAKIISGGINQAFGTL